DAGDERRDEAEEFPQEKVGALDGFGEQRDGGAVLEFLRDDEARGDDDDDEAPEGDGGHAHLAHHVDFLVEREEREGFRAEDGEGEREEEDVIEGAAGDVPVRGDGQRADITHTLWVPGIPRVSPAIIITANPGTG